LQSLVRSGPHKMTNSQSNWLIFPTALGHCGVSWRAQGVTAFMLPEATPARIQKELQTITGVKKPATTLPAWIRALVQQVKLHLKGKPQDFSAVPVVIDHATDFMQAVYKEAQRIPSGSVVSYAQLAERLGKPGAVRAVGTALGKKSGIPLIIPCHRIITTAGKIGGFSANGGIAAKEVLLACEGVNLEKPRLIITAAQWRDRCAIFAAVTSSWQKLSSRLVHFPFKPKQNA
jgi:methylated-DNA-[protein]-cysteine S-methyltransferase